MTVSRLTEEADSQELSEWLVYFEVAEEKRKEHAERAKFERSITGD